VILIEGFMMSSFGLALYFTVPISLLHFIEYC